MADPLTDARLFDLVRYARGHLFEEGLLTREEYARLLTAPGESVARLGTYDEIVREVAAAAEVLEVLALELKTENLGRLSERARMTADRLKVLSAVTARRCLGKS